MEKLNKKSLILEIKKLLSEKILQTGNEESIQDSDLSNLDSIGRLSLMVELENLSESELMGEQLTDSHFISLEALADYVIMNLQDAVQRQSGDLI